MIYTSINIDGNFNVLEEKKTMSIDYLFIPNFSITKNRKFYETNSHMPWQSST